MADPGVDGHRRRHPAVRADLRLEVPKAQARPALQARGEIRHSGPAPVARLPRRVRGRAAPVRPRRRDRRRRGARGRRLVPRGRRRRVERRGLLRDPRRRRRRRADVDGAQPEGALLGPRRPARVPHRRLRPGRDALRRRLRRGPESARPGRQDRSLRRVAAGARAERALRRLVPADAARRRGRGARGGRARARRRPAHGDGGGIRRIAGQVPRGVLHP